MILLYLGINQSLSCFKGGFAFNLFCLDSYLTTLSWGTRRMLPFGLRKLHCMWIGTHTTGQWRSWNPPNRMGISMLLFRCQNKLRKISFLHHYKKLRKPDGIGLFSKIFPSLGSFIGYFVVLNYKYDTECNTCRLRIRQDQSYAPSSVFILTM